MAAVGTEVVVMEVAGADLLAHILDTTTGQWRIDAVTVLNAQADDEGLVVSSGGVVLFGQNAFPYILTMYDGASWSTVTFPGQPPVIGA